MGRLETIAQGVWSLPVALRFWGVETGSRMTVVRLPGERLFVHSPVPLEDSVADEVDMLGSVAAIVAPSLFHHLSVRPWEEAYPEAIVACCPGLESKRPDIGWDRILGDASEPEWKGTLEQVHFAARSLESEVVFFHPASRTMICADALFNLHAHPSRLTRVVATLLGNTKPGATWLERLMIRDRAGARRQVDRMLAWRPQRIVVAHGAIIEHDAQAVLREAYAWL